MPQTMLGRFRANNVQYTFGVHVKMNDRENDIKFIEFSMNCEFIGWV